MVNTELSAGDVKYDKTLSLHLYFELISRYKIEIKTCN